MFEAVVRLGFDKQRWTKPLSAPERRGYGVWSNRLWNNTHTATLEDYELTDKDLYHPSAVQKP